MKIIKKKEVITEEIEIKAGVYYFSNSEGVYKMDIQETDKEGFTKYKFESLINFNNIYSIKVKEDELYPEEDISFYFQQFILGTSGKEIEKEEYYKERQDILDRLCK